METTLIYNPHAGLIDSITLDEIVDMLRAAGYSPEHHPTKTEADLDAALEDIEGHVTVAGGDGTVRATVLRLVGHDATLSIVPIGRANNVARSLGIYANPRDAVAGLTNPVRRPFDVGRVRAPWGEEYFVEACGWGLFAEMFAYFGPDEERTLPKAIQAVVEALADYEATHCQIELDGADLTGNYMLVEVFNGPAFGPRLSLAPQADPGDGLLDVLHLEDGVDMETLVDYLTSLLAEEPGEQEDVMLEQGKHLRVEWDGFSLHVDGKVCPQSDGPFDGSELYIEVIPGALDVLLPEERD